MTRQSSQEKRLEALYAIYEEGVQVIADEVREKYLVPFCDKHGLRFVSGMGRWFFIDKDGTHLDEAEEDIDPASNFGSTSYRPLGYLHSGMETRRYHCKRLLGLLHLVPDGSRNSDIGDWIGDYTPAGHIDARGAE